jgi:LuxR family transcriptional regulator, maltose regulon positive regulatory protein
MAGHLKILIRAQQRGRAAALIGPARDHLDRVVQAFRLPTTRAGSASPEATGLIEQLTMRELEVLGFIAAGRRNQEIADELVVTLDTVKKHMSNILRKLGASSRTQAVARARELGLIS